MNVGRGSGTNGGVGEVVGKPRGADLHSATLGAVQANWPRRRDTSSIPALAPYPQLIMPSLIELPKLKSLALHYTTLVHVSYNTTSSSSEVVWSFPSLEILSIPDSLKDLVIDAPKLKEFNIAKWPGDDVLDRINSGVIKVLAPNLRFFKCDDCMMRNFSFKDLSYLDQACFSITTDDFRNAPIMKDSLVHCATRVVVQTCPHIKYLTLDGFAVEALFESPAVLENASLRFRNLEYLNLSVHLSGNCVIAIMHLLKLSPGIETINLVINYQNQETSNRTNMAKCRNLWISKECLLQQLRFVKIEGVVGSENELKLMKFVLKNALVLEKVSICCSEKALPRMLINFNKKVNEIPLASSPQISIPFLYDL
ncbi:hypothetical protein Sjap_010664 [Stephania japonica]|uniref:FBD domain-containing protein n=1 Tax=Stephania japonica TaxID=461633 RepID=A0AAP0P3W6_9MAGN